MNKTLKITLIAIDKTYYLWYNINIRNKQRPEPLTKKRTNTML